MVATFAIVKYVLRELAIKIHCTHFLCLNICISYRFSRLGTMREVNHKARQAGVSLHSKSFIEEAFSNIQSLCGSIDFAAIETLASKILTRSSSEKSIFVVGARGAADRSVGMLKSTLTQEFGVNANIVAVFTDGSNSSKNDFTSVMGRAEFGDLVIFLKQPYSTNKLSRKKLSDQSVTVYALKSSGGQDKFFDGIIASYNSILPDEAVFFLIVRSIVSSLLGRAIEAETQFNRTVVITH